MVDLESVFERLWCIFGELWGASITGRRRATSALHLTCVSCQHESTPFQMSFIAELHGNVEPTEGIQNIDY